MTSEFSLAIHALVVLSLRGGTVSSELLAKSICTNPARVRRVLAKLKKAGLVETKEGVDGGYQLIVPPEQVSLAQVARGLDAQFVRTTWRSGEQDMDCLVASGMASVLDNLYAHLNALCYAGVEKLTVADIERQIISGGAASPRTVPSLSKSDK